MQKVVETQDTERRTPSRSATCGADQAVPSNLKAWTRPTATQNPADGQDTATRLAGPLAAADQEWPLYSDHVDVFPTPVPVARHDVIELHDSPDIDPPAPNIETGFVQLPLR
ncbi:MAG: hypothetical protein J2P57_11285 [Acidimicrobiaceae bacterium]|nr:hypothetical protein [Acidimicrobiaceae bacterium]